MSNESLSGSSTFSVEDLIGLPSLVGRLTQPTRKFDIWLATRLSTQTQSALAAYQAASTNPAGLKEALQQELNKLIQDESIYEQERFAGITLRSEVQTLLSQGPQGIDLHHLNRLLVEDAYPLELSRNRLSSVTHKLESKRETDRNAEYTARYLYPTDRNENPKPKENAGEIRDVWRSQLRDIKVALGLIDGGKDYPKAFARLGEPRGELPESELIKFQVQPPDENWKLGWKCGNETYFRLSDYLKQDQVEPKDCKTVVTKFIDTCADACEKAHKFDYLLRYFDWDAFFLCNRTNGESDPKVEVEVVYAHYLYACPTRRYTGTDIEKFHRPKADLEYKPQDGDAKWGFGKPEDDEKAAVKSIRGAIDRLPLDEQGELQEKLKEKFRNCFPEEENTPQATVKPERAATQRKALWINPYAWATGAVLSVFILLAQYSLRKQFSRGPSATVQKIELNAGTKELPVPVVHNGMTEFRDKIEDDSIEGIANTITKGTGGRRANVTLSAELASISLEKEYDGTTNKEVKNVKVTGFGGVANNCKIDAEIVYKDKNAGTNKSVSINFKNVPSGYSLNSVVRSNGVITPKKLTLAPRFVKNYDATEEVIWQPSKTDLSKAGMLPNDNLILELGGSFKDPNAGTNKLVDGISVTNGCDQLTNYSIVTLTNVYGNINKKIINAEDVEVLGKEYDGKTNADVRLKGPITELVGSNKILMASFDRFDLGTNSVKLTLLPEGEKNFEIAPNLQLVGIIRRKLEGAGAGIRGNSNENVKSRASILKEKFEKFKDSPDRKLKDLDKSPDFVRLFLEFGGLLNFEGVDVKLKSYSPPMEKTYIFSLLMKGLLFEKDGTVKKPSLSEETSDTPKTKNFLEACIGILDFLSAN
jgi:hypothetical protein